MSAHQAPPSLGFSRQEHWSGLPCPSPMHASEEWKWSRSVVSDSLRPHGLQPTRLLHPWEFPGKSTGVGCHCLLRMKVLEACISRWAHGKRGTAVHKSDIGMDSLPSPLPHTERRKRTSDHPARLPRLYKFTVHSLGTKRLSRKFHYYIKQAPRSMSEFTMLSGMSSLIRE